MLRFYLSNDSYPEVREIASRWQRHLTWWRAFRSAAGDRHFWLFLLVQMILLVGWVVLHAWLTDLARPHEPAGMIIHIACAVGAVVTWGALALSWGGDLMRPHLRKVSLIARSACPNCGHQLTSQLAGDEASIRCPECGSVMGRSAFEAPYEIPPEFRAIRLRLARRARPGRRPR
jgi:predicted RNA-binding Zn-ribbon protein involved in translation (DUF1610 family)